MTDQKHGERTSPKLYIDDQGYIPDPWLYRKPGEVILHMGIDWGHSEPVVAILVQGSPQAISAYHERERLRSSVVEAAMLSHQSFNAVQALRLAFKSRSEAYTRADFDAYLMNIDELEDAVNEGENALQSACEALEAAQEAKPK